jgi:hypothetical protein
VGDERVWRAEGNRARVDDTCAQEKNTERNNVGTLGRVEEQEWRNTSGQWKWRNTSGKNLWPLIPELTTLLSIEAELTANLVLVRLVWLARATINLACGARHTTIIFLMV